MTATITKNDRFYWVGTPPKPHVRVTEALSIIRQPWLEHWRGSVGNEEADRRRDEASELGTEVHAACAAVLRNEWIAVAGWTPEQELMLEAFRSWANQAVEQVHDIEATVISERWQYGGTPDLLITLRGERLPQVWDIKTGADSPLHALQTAAYLAALREGGRKLSRVRGRLALRKGADAGRSVVTRFQDPQDEAHFLYALALWRRFHPDWQNGGRT